LSTSKGKIPFAFRGFVPRFPDQGLCPGLRPLGAPPIDPRYIGSLRVFGILYSSSTFPVVLLPLVPSRLVIEGRFSADDAAEKVEEMTAREVDSTSYCGTFSTRLNLRHFGIPPSPTSG